MVSRETDPARAVPGADRRRRRGHRRRLRRRQHPVGRAAEHTVMARFGARLRPAVPRPDADPGHGRGQPEGRRRQDHDDGEHRRRARRSSGSGCWSSTSTRRATRPPRWGRAPARGAVDVRSRRRRRPARRRDRRGPDLPGAGVVPATIDLAGAEIELVSVVARESRLHKAIHGHPLVGERRRPGGPIRLRLVDCPPSLGLLTLNALVSGEEMMIPIQAEYYALEGLGQLLETVEMVRATSTRGSPSRRSWSRCTTPAPGSPPASPTRCASTSATRCSRPRSRARSGCPRRRRTARR